MKQKWGKIFRNRWTRIFLWTLVFLATCVISSNVWINVYTGRYLYDRVEDVPAREVCLVLGTSQYLRNGYKNLFFEYRIDAAVRLYRSGKVKHILVSGDNSTINYDEPAMMKKALIKRGIPACRITCDYAGFRTFDSVIRTWKVFGQKSFLVVSQKFHNQRAVFLGRKNGLDVIGFNARDVTGTNGLRTHVREYLARFKAVIDLYIWPARPRFLGSPEPLTSCDSTAGADSTRVIDILLAP